MQMATGVLAKGVKPGYGPPVLAVPASAGPAAPGQDRFGTRAMATKDDERAARLKAALRDNLRRRKAQARGRADDTPGVGSEPVPKMQSAEKD